MSDSLANAPTYKVVIAGDGNVGKTSLVRRYCDGKFEESRIMTLGVDFQLKTMSVGDKTIKLSIWDVAGQNRFVSFRDTFYRGAHAAALVYDVTSPATFFSLMHWRDEIQSVVPNIPMVVIGNKTDLNPVIPHDEAQGWAKNLGMAFLETSALSGEHVTELFAGLAYLALKEQQRREGEEEGSEEPQTRNTR